MIKIYTFQFNDADFLEWQYKTFKKFLREPHEIICINNSFDKPNEKAAIKNKAKELGITHYFPHNVDNNKGGGRAHQTAIQWAWDSLIIQNNDINIIIDHDMFLIRPFSPDLNYDITAIMQGRGTNIRYFHPGFIVFNNTLKDKETMNFIGEKIDGYDCDSGGNTFRYITAHPKLKIKGINLINIAKEHENLNVLPKEAQEGYVENIPMQICEDFMIHFLGGSNWYHAQPNIFSRKKEQLIQTLNYYINL